MPRYEYKVVPAPNKGLKGKNVKGAEARFSHALQELMNGLSGYGWEYQRAETLPSIERAGLTGSTTEWRNVLVFRRLRETDTEMFSPELLPAPQAFTADHDAVEAKKAEIARSPKDYDGFFEGENGVEAVDDLKSAPSVLSTLASRRKKSATAPEDAVSETAESKDAVSKDPAPEAQTAVRKDPEALKQEAARSLRSKD
jgi:hypothetical protein